MEIVHTTAQRQQCAAHSIVQTGVIAMSNEQVETWSGIASVVILLPLIGIIGNMDYEDTLLQQDHYCKMVAKGAWPDYDEVYKGECVALGYPAVPADLHLVGDATR